MKKVLLVVAILLLTVPAMAATTITVYNEGNYDLPDGNKATALRVGYVSDVDIRAFALELNVDPNCNFQKIRDFNVGESNGAAPGGKSGYGIFPSRFRDFINPLNGSQIYSGDGGWADPNYNPTPQWDEPGTISPRAGIGFTKLITEQGTLFSGDANKPALSGTLFRVDVNSYGQPGTYNVTVAADALRGGIVDACAVGVTATFVGTQVVIPPGGCTVPNLVGLSRTAARAAITAAGFPIGTEANVAPTSSTQAVRTVIAQKQTAGAVLPCSTPIDFNAVSYPVKDTAPSSMFANWVGRGRPACWAYPRQCHGDADGKKQVSFWVGSNDLAVLRGAISKLETAIPAGGICADFDHKKQVSFWVGSNDLNILRAYVSKLESLVPVCGSIPPASAGFSADPNYWYFCLPTGVTCPTGQYCAPAGVCPNTP